MPESAKPALPTGVPMPNLDSQPFWDATAEERLTLQRCMTCGEVIWWSRAICPTCSSFDLGRFDAAGTGSIYSYTVVRRGSGAWQDAAPYVIAFVELDEGPRLMTNIVECDPEVVTIGAKVSVVWHDTGAGSALPRFMLTQALPRS